MRDFLRLASAVTLGLFAFNIPTALNAADIRERSVYAAPGTASLKDGPVAISTLPAITWTGFYLGAHVGYGNANHEINVEGDSFNFLNLNGLNSSGVVGGVNGGFDYSNGRVLFGVLGGYTWDGMETSLSIFDGALRADLEKNDEWYIGGRAGIHPTQGTLIYIGGAYVQTEYELSAGGFKQTEDYDGFKALAGFEMHLGGGVFTKLEYQHNFLGDATWLNDDGAKITDTADEDIFLFGLHYKFGASNLPNL